MDARTRAWRILAKGGHVVGYRSLDPGAANDDLVVKRVALAPGEEAIGVYENAPAPDAHAFIVTTHALRVVAPTGEQVIPYDRIQSVAGPTTKDVARPMITVALDDGTRVQLAVLGRNAKALDVFEVLRFLQRVVQDRRGGAAMR